MFVYIFFYTNLVTLADHTDRQGQKQKPIATSKYNFIQANSLEQFKPPLLTISLATKVFSWQLGTRYIEGCE
jgi:hypothetical protein